MSRQNSSPPLIAESDAMKALRKQAIQVAVGDAKVLITGESGVGKEIIARYIHANSQRKAGPFVAVNCAAFTESLLESELFGHARGSFTGAHRATMGKVQLARTGSIFLDEIGETSLRMQSLLLRFLESGEIQTVGADAHGVTVDVRVLAATNRDLDTLVAAGKFREDLLYRIKVVHLDVPPLRARRADIRPLINLAIDQIGRSVLFTDEALEALEQYRWPGNVRQLQNLVEQLVWMFDDKTVRVEDLPGALRTPGGSSVLLARERRRQIADELYRDLTSGEYSFWDHAHPLFVNRDITRHDIRELVKRGLADTCGNYRALIRRLGMPSGDYKRFLNFLAAHDCRVDFREFRGGEAHKPKVTTPDTVMRRTQRTESATSEQKSRQHGRTLEGRS